MVIEQNKLSELLSLASEFNTNDILVDLNSSELIFMSDELVLDVASCRKLIAKAQNSIREQGVNPLCFAKGSLTWQRNGKEIETPIWLVPTSFEINKVKNTVTFSTNEEDAIINPFLGKQLLQVFEIQLSSELTFDELFILLENKGFVNLKKDLVVLGNFHHHRYEILRELEELSKMNSFPFGLASLLGLESHKKSKPISLPKSELLPADDDHRLAFELFRDNDLVIQGPPGTGKSQILTNFIGKLLLSEQSMVVVSEKRSALEVIYQKMQSLNLATLGFISTPDLTTKDFLKSLKEAWEFYENYTPSKRKDISVRQVLEADLGLKMKILSQEKLIGGVNFTTFQRLKNEVDLSHFQYRNRLPDLQLIDEKRKIIQPLFALEINQLVGSIRFNFFENELGKLQEYLDEFYSFATLLDTKFDTKNALELDVLIQKSISCQLFEHELAQKHKSLLVPKSKEQKGFVKSSNLFFSVQQALKECENLSEWKIIPSDLELKSIKNQFENGNFWEKRKAKKRWKALNHLSWDESKNSINRLEKKYRLQEELNTLNAKFKAQGIQNPETELPQLLNLIPLFTKEKWEIYETLTKNDSENISLFRNKIDRFKANLKHFFNVHENQLFVDFFHQLTEKFHLILEQQPRIAELNAITLETMRDQKDYATFLSTVLGSHFTDFKKNYPILSEFEMSNLGQEIESIIASEASDRNCSIEQIHQSVFEKFKAFQTLLSTPASKLKDSQKALKAELRKGKALLVKEFAKTKNHPSLRELFNSEAKHWIKILKPVWLSNPAQLAKSFPLEQATFDVCIFDEASQIPLQNSLGTLYRSKRIIIAGDEQQMGPTNYFKSGNEELTSLLQHANFYLKRVGLKHHYRSAHPALIAFSNRHFYDNELAVFPSFPLNLSPISFLYCAAGKFINRRNVAEAKQVVELLKQTISNSETVGVVAFSQEQIDCIWENMDETLRTKVERRIDRNTLFFKPLEKVQGDECEYLIISMAYGKDEDGNFAMRFGPLNLASGRNRLNVLFSRASKKIAFITSVLPDEMKLSENESVNLLRQWLRYAHDLSTNSAQKLNPDVEVQFPFHLKPKISGQTLLFSNIHEHLNSVNEMITLHRVLRERAWNINYK